MFYIILNQHINKKNDVLQASKQQTELFGTKKLMSTKELSKMKFKEYEFTGKYLDLFIFILLPTKKTTIKIMNKFLLFISLIIISFMSFAQDQTTSIIEYKKWKNSFRFGVKKCKVRKDTAFALSLIHI